MRRVLPLLLLTFALAGCAEPLFGPPRRFVVFFQPFSTELGPAARAVVQHAAERAKENSSAPVEVVGYADQVGTPAQNAALSASRAQVVASLLAADGVIATRIVARGVGPVPATGVLYRRATIAIVTPGGAPLTAH